MEWQKVLELLFIQFPVAVLNLSAVYFAFRFIDRRDARLDERADRIRKEIREETEREIARLREVHKEHLDSKEQEAARLADGLTDQVKDLAEKVDKLLEKRK
jgi:hypothetical protein